MTVLCTGKPNVSCDSLYCGDLQYLRGMPVYTWFLLQNQLTY
jgi:hypothetical protein